MVDFRILRAVRRAHRELIALAFRRADLGIFRSKPSRKEGPKKYSRITSSKVRNDTSQ